MKFKRHKELNDLRYPGKSRILVNRRIFIKLSFFSYLVQVYGRLTIEISTTYKKTKIQTFLITTKYFEKDLHKEPERRFNYKIRCKYSEFRETSFTFRLGFS